VIDETSEMIARVPDRFRERQWTRLPGGTAPADFAERVTRLLAGARATAPTTPAPAPAPAPAYCEPARANEGFGVAVLPFKYRGANGDLMTLAEVLSGEIVTGLSRFSYLRVLKVRPGFAGMARKHIERWWDPEYVERLIDGWRKAGLEIPPANTTLTQP
jgi:hypothetical protein